MRECGVKDQVSRAEHLLCIEWPHHAPHPYHRLARRTEDTHARLNPNPKDQPAPRGARPAVRGLARGASRLLARPRRPRRPHGQRHLGGRGQGSSPRGPLHHPHGRRASHGRHPHGGSALLRVRAAAALLGRRGPRRRRGLRPGRRAGRGLRVCLRDRALRRLRCLRRGHGRPGRRRRGHRRGGLLRRGRHGALLACLLGHQGHCGRPCWQDRGRPGGLRLPARLGERRHTGRRAGLHQPQRGFCRP